MKNIARIIVLLLGIGFLLYGAYTFVQPEASVDLLGMSIEEQDNKQAFISLGIGALLTILGVAISRKSLSGS